MKHTITELFNYGTQYPTQWTGRTDDFRLVYFRYRHHCISVRIGQPWTAPIYLSAEELASEVWPDDFDIADARDYDAAEPGGGVMTYEELRGVMGDLFEFPGSEQ